MAGFGRCSDLHLFLLGLLESEIDGRTVGANHGIHVTNGESARRGRNFETTVEGGEEGGNGGESKNDSEQSGGKHWFGSFGRGWFLSPAQTL